MTEKNEQRRVKRAEKHIEPLRRAYQDYYAWLYRQSIRKLRYIAKSESTFTGVNCGWTAYRVAPIASGLAREVLREKLHARSAARKAKVN